MNDVEFTRSNHNVTREICYANDVTVRLFTFDDSQPRTLFSALVDWPRHGIGSVCAAGGGFNQTIYRYDITSEEIQACRDDMIAACRYLNI